MGGFVVRLHPIHTSCGKIHNRRNQQQLRWEGGWRHACIARSPARCINGTEHASTSKPPRTALPTRAGC